MKPKTIVYDAPFEKRLSKYLSSLTGTQKNSFRKKLEIFKEDVFDKRLKTHKLKGNLSDYYAFSISGSDRLVFRIISGNSVLFIEIGSHDICY